MLDEERIPRELIRVRPEYVSCVTSCRGEPGAQALVGLVRCRSRYAQMLLEHGTVRIGGGRTAMSGQRQACSAPRTTFRQCRPERTRTTLAASNRPSRRGTGRRERNDTSTRPLGPILLTVGKPRPCRSSQRSTARVPAQRLRIHVYVECRRIGAIEQTDFGGWATPARRPEGTKEMQQAQSPRTRVLRLHRSSVLMPGAAGRTHCNRVQDRRRHGCERSRPPMPIAARAGVD